jgi:hypothetical protein
MKETSEIHYWSGRVTQAVESLALASTSANPSITRGGERKKLNNRNHY